MMRCIVAAALAALLVGCGTTGMPQVEQKVVEVKVKVKEPCIDKAPARPAYKFGKGERPKSDGEMARILAEDFERAEQYGVDWEAAASGCLTTPDQ